LMVNRLIQAVGSRRGMLGFGRRGEPLESEGSVVGETIAYGTGEKSAGHPGRFSLGQKRGAKLNCGGMMGAQRGKAA
jgi:hypothetical protein